MPLLRKRKTKEKVSDDVEKRERKESPTILKHSEKKDRVSSSKAKVKESSSNSRSKRRKNVSFVFSDEESSKTKCSQKKNVTENFSSPRKDPKLTKAKVVLHSLHVKDESSDSENSVLRNLVHSGISSQTPISLYKAESKSDITVKSGTSVSLSDNNKQSEVKSSSESEWDEVESKSNVKKSSTKSLSTRKKNLNDVSSDAGSSKTKISQKKKHVKENRSSSKKDSKLTIEKIVHSFNIKEHSESDDLMFRNSIDSGISSETSTNKGKNESILDMIIKSETTCSSNSNQHSKGGSSSSESDWEEVEEHCEASLDDYKPDIPKEGVEITIDCPDLQVRKRKKKQFDENEWIRLHINRVRKDIQLSIYKTHLLCLLAHGIYVNEVLNSDSVKALALSLMPNDILSFTSGKKVDKVDISGIEKVVSWFCNTFSFENEKCVFLNIFSSVVNGFVNKKSMNASEYNLMFIAVSRILGLKVRFCVSLYPVTYKASNLIKKPSSKRPKKSEPVEETEKKEENKPETSPEQKVKLKKEKIPKVFKEKKQTNSAVPKKKLDKKSSRPRRSTGKNYKLSSEEDDNSDDKDFKMNDYQSSDNDFQSSSNISSKRRRRPHSKSSNRKVLSSDSEPSSPQQSALESKNIVCWAEVYSKPDKQWISIECSNNIINKPYDIEVLAPTPVSYILAFDNESYVKDVTRRYCNNYMTTTVKLRVDPEWWEDTLEPFLPPNSAQNKAEEKKLDEMLVNKPLPTTIQGFKNHPLYALKRHLLKFEAIYPPDAPPVGFMRSEPVYARDCVHQLHSRETWLKEARVVRIGEEPYKIVKARPKWDRIAGVMKTDLPLEIFGFWQTEPYEPPVAVNGKVPRSEYGNVELFKPCMLPRGTVHLQLPGLNRIAKKLGIDCSPAIVGFDGHKGSVHPVFEGFVICEEFKDTIIAAWDEEQENSRKREAEKRDKRIYGNWKKLIKGLLIRERIKLKYDVK